MANAEKVFPSVMIQLGDQEYEAIFNLRAFILLEQKTGKNALTGEIWQNPSMSDIATLLWAAVNSQHDEPVISFAEVGKNLLPSDVGIVTEKLMEAFAAASPGEQKKEKGGKKKRAS